MGAPREVIKAALESHAVYQRKAFSSPGDITDANWTEHYGDERCATLLFAERNHCTISSSYYQAYVNFFAEKVLKDGIEPIVVKYIHIRYKVELGRWPGGQEATADASIL